MKTKRLYLLLSVFPILITIFWACGGQKAQQNPDGVPAVAYNPFVNAFTSGTISRHSDIRIVFSKDVDESRLNAAAISKHIKFKPAAEGEFVFEDDHTILFSPKNDFAPNTVYNVTVDLAGWFEADKDLRNFNFSFTTMPAVLHGSLDSFDVDEDGNRYRFVIVSRDTESPETIKSVVSISEDADIEWEHSADGKHHELTVNKVQSKSKARNLEVKVGNNKLGIETGVLVSAQVPDSSDFRIYDVVTTFHPERYVEVSFTHRLDKKQDLKGLLFIQDNRSTSYEISGNKVKLYPDSDRSGTIEIYIDGAVRNAGGSKLGETTVRQVNVNNLVPAVRFIGRGAIIPQTDNLSVPFESVYLRGVTVSVIRIFEHNAGQFLQINNLTGGNQMRRVGRLIAHKTIFFDGQANDLKRWNTFAVNLNDFVNPEPEAIYRIQLSFDSELSLYDMCDSPLYSMTEEQIRDRDEEQFQQMLGNIYDKGDPYYEDFYEDYYYYDDYDYEYDYSSSDPCGYWFYYNRTVSRNILATNLGLTVKAGTNDEAVAFVNNILTTEPEKDVRVQLFNYQQQLLGEGVTNPAGRADIKYKGGKPFYAIASKGNQRTYMRIDDGSSLSTSSFDVSGEVVQRGVKGFIYGERGVWRPGDDIHLTFMLNDRNNVLPADQPVIMELYNPLGRLFTTRTESNGLNGIYVFTVSTEDDSPTGLWQAVIKVGGLRFTKGIRVETVKPNRLKIDLKIPEGVVLANQTFSMPLHVEWLTGATARSLDYDIEGTVTSIPVKFDGFAGYTFDDPAKVRTELSGINIASGSLDESGKATVKAIVNLGNTFKGFAKVNLLTSVFEDSGEFSIDGRSILCSPHKQYAGIKSPAKGGEQLNTGETHKFSVALAGYEGNPVKGAIKVEVFKLNWYWWWSSGDGRLANYISEQHREPVKTMTVNTNAKGIGSFDLSFENKDWGNYYIRVSDNQGRHSSGIIQYFDWPNYWGKRRDDGSDSAFRLNFTTDRTTYAPGDDMVITFPSSAGSRAIVTVENGSKVLTNYDLVCSDGETVIKIKATEEMMPNAYIYVMLLQPYENTVNDVPIRLYGIVPVTVTSEQSRLKPVIATKDEFRPGEKYEIVVSEQNGRPMSYTLAIVDEGLLDLTAFGTPDPWRVFNAREALGIRTWDMYNFVIGAYGGRIEQMFSIGGDEETAAKVKNTVNRFTPVVKFEGPFTLKKGAKNKHVYDMPNYNGRVRIMVVASDGSAYGSADKSVIVRKPVMLLGTLPRVIGINEEMSVPASVFATVKNVGNVKVTIECTGDMTVVGDSVVNLNFKDVSDQTVRFAVRTGNTSGKGHVRLTATAQNGEKSVYETDIEIRSVRKPVTRTITAGIEPGKSWSESVRLPGLDGTNGMTLEVSGIEPVNLTNRLDYLIGYPHGCIEQITSKGFPQLYLKYVADLTPEQQKVTEESVKEVLRRLRSYQTAEGAFAYWPGGTSTAAWATVYATHFMLEAEKGGYLVPSSVKDDAIANLRTVARSWKSVSGSYSRSEELIQAYRLWVLSMTGKPEMGAMNRMKEQTGLSAMSKWTLAAAYAEAGQKDAAKGIVANTGDSSDKVDYGYDLTYGSDLRDKSICMLVMSATDDMNNAALLLKHISKSLSSDNWYSTQTTAFALMAVSKYVERHVSGKGLDFSYDAAKKSGKIRSDKNVWSKEIFTNGAAGTSEVNVSNNTDHYLFVRVITSGTPEQGEETAYSNNVELNISFIDENGHTVDVRELDPGVKFSARIRVLNTTSMPLRNLVLTNIVPSGWEIVNRRFVFEDESQANGSALSYQDIRDDRVFSYIDYLPARTSAVVHIDLISAYSGRFYMPPVFCEAMYDNLTQANTEGYDVVVR